MAKFAIPRATYNNGYSNLHSNILNWCAEHISPQSEVIEGDDVLCFVPVRIEGLKKEYYEIIDNHDYDTIWTATKNAGLGWKVIIVHYTDHKDIGYIQIVLEIMDDTFAVQFKLAFM
jgi:hypothetical protein